MKTARAILKMIAWSLAAVAAVCCVIAYWDKLIECVRRFRAGLEKRGCCRSEYDDYADWDE